MKTLRPASLSFGVIILATATSFTACRVDDNTPLEQDHNATHRRIIDIRATALQKDSLGKTTKPRPFGIINGSPVVPEGKELGAFYQTSGVRAARYPLGWGCDITLDYIFDNESADPDSNESYRRVGFDSVTKDLIRYKILPIYQAAWDIGTDGCQPTETIGVSTRPIAAYDNWARVVAEQARYLNSTIKSFYNKPEMIEKLAESGWRPGYVEIYPDATDAGGYGDLDIGSVASAFKAFQEIISETIPDDGHRLFGVVTPGLRISSPAELTAGYSAIADFIANLPTNPAHLPDMFTIKPEVDSISSLIAVTDAVRAALDDAGHADVPLAAFDLNVTPETWENLSVFADTIESRSAWLGALTATAYIRLQSKLLTIAPGRWSTLDQAELGPKSGEDLFQYPSSGLQLPAMPMTKAIRLFAEEGTELLAIENEPVDDAPGDVDDSGFKNDLFSVLASRRADGGYQFLVAALNPADQERRGLNMQYQLNITDLAAGTTGWQVAVYETDDTTQYLPTSPARRGIVKVDEGKVSVAGIIKAPAVHLIQLLPPSSE
ncbi:MAG TPA: hypothetical protein PKH54_11205 [Myxococcota bacterium]|nr:hypothetical protein [Myxococcota bacterium]